MPCHKEHHHRSHGSVKYKSCHAIGIKERFAQLLCPQAVDDMEHHHQENQAHAEGNRHHEYRIQISYERKCGHCFGGTQPERFYHVFKAKHTAETETENGGKDTAAAYDGRKVCLLYTSFPSGAFQGFHLHRHLHRVGT